MHTRKQMKEYNKPSLKKSFGQHLLTRAGLLQRIADVAADHDVPNLLEVGPGMGALTQHLLLKNKHFLAVEADWEMQQYLLDSGILQPDQLISADVLRIDFTKLFGGEPFILCGNFPYNISSQILMNSLHHADRIPVFAGLFQQELAQRITAPFGSRAYGGISVLTQLVYHPRKCFDIDPSAFRPPPKVNSSMLCLLRREDRPDAQSFTGIQKLVRHAFQYRRKTLRNNLKSYVRDPGLLADPYFELRAEAIPPEAFPDLWRRLTKTS